MPLIYPERGTDYALRRPAPYTAGTPGADGTPLDAGTAMLMQCEAAHLIHESCRHLASGFGPGANTGEYTDPEDVWNGISGAEPPTEFVAGEYTNVWERIPWDRKTALKVPISHAIEDRADSDGDARQRILELRLHIEVDASVTSGTAYFAVTNSPSAASIVRETPLVSVALTAGIAQVAAASFTLADPVAPASVRMRARADSALGAESLASPLWLWAGWRLLTPSPGSSRVLSFSAWERR